MAITALDVYVFVAPLAGAWIEINDIVICSRSLWVAPLAGAWIEMLYGYGDIDGTIRRSPCGSVD